VRFASGMLIVTGVVFVIVGFIMHTLRRMAARQHHRMVSMSWAQIAEMRRNQGPVRRMVSQRAPSPRGGTLIMYAGLSIGAFGLLVLMAGY
jgi:hypothetical protein